MRCDFCGDPDPVTELPCKGTPWAACSPCAELVEADAWSALVSRAMARIVEELNVPPDMTGWVEQQIRDAQAQFRNDRAGDAIPLSP